jgi:hypothetical protein
MIVVPNYKFPLNIKNNNSTACTQGEKLPGKFPKAEIKPSFGLNKIV